MKTGHNQPLLLRKQLLGLLILLLLIVIVESIVHHHPPKPIAEEMPVPDSLQTKTRYRTRRDTIVLRLQPFDPNTADSLTLLHLGLKPWQVKNMLKYRAKNGRYRIKTDLLRLYGMTDSLYQTLAPFILLPDSLPDKHLDTDSLRNDSLPTFRTHEKRDTLIDINHTDTDELQLIRGIGSYTAQQIIRYGQKLGGYYSPEQVREINGLDYAQWDSILPHLWADTTSIIRIPVNQASVPRLQQHPYITFTQAQAVYQLRRKRIRLHSINDLQNLPFTPQEIQRLTYYLDFQEVKTQ